VCGEPPIDKCCGEYTTGDYNQGGVHEPNTRTSLSRIITKWRQGFVNCINHALLIMGWCSVKSIILIEKLYSSSTTTPKNNQII